MLLASSRESPGMLPSILQCTQQIIIQLKMSVVLLWRNLATELVFVEMIFCIYEWERNLMSNNLKFTIFFLFFYE